MTAPTVTQRDHAALRQYMAERAKLAFGQRDCTTAPYADLLLDTLARHREQTVAEVVAWLRAQVDPEWTLEYDAVLIRNLAHDLESGEWSAS